MSKKYKSPEDSYTNFILDKLFNHFINPIRNPLSDISISLEIDGKYSITISGYDLE